MFVVSLAIVHHCSCILRLSVLIFRFICTIFAVFYYVKVSTKRPLPDNSDGNCSLTTKPDRAPWSGFSRHQWLNCRRLLACSLSVPFASRVYLCIVVWFVLSMTATVFASVHAIIWISKLYYFVRHAAYTCHDLIIKQHKPSALTWTFNGVSFASCQQRCVWCGSDSITILAHPRSSCLPPPILCMFPTQGYTIINYTSHEISSHLSVSSLT